MAKPGRIIDQEEHTGTALYPSEDLYPSTSLYPSSSSNYGGYLFFGGYTNRFTDDEYPDLLIELFIKEYTVPNRKRSVTEINTPRQYDPVADATRGVNAMFKASPDMLTATFSGFLKTPIVNHYYTPKDTDGNSIAAFSGYSYGDIVMLYLSGEINQSAGGALRRKDPDIFVDGYGNRYNNPVISSWEYSPVPNFPKIQNFSATLLLET